MASFSIPSTLGASGGTAIVGSGRVLEIGETVSFSHSIHYTFAQANTFNLANHVGFNYVPVIDGLRANLVGFSRDFYIPRIENISGSSLTISLQTAAPSVNQYKTSLNHVLSNNSAINVDYDNNVWWSTSSAEVVTTNVQVPVGNSFRWYEFKWWCMEVNNNKIIFTSITRLL